jgi:hypothetical protein
MSKEAALRAMREAAYAERQAGTRAAAPKPARPAPVAPATKKTASPTVGASSSDELCGHRSMNGRSCTREQGHAAKSHRYS